MLNVVDFAQGTTNSEVLFKNDKNEQWLKVWIMRREKKQKISFPLNDSSKAINDKIFFALI